MVKQFLQGKLKDSIGGSLKGAYPEPLTDSLPEFNLQPSKKYNVKPPSTSSCLPGTQFLRKVHGKTVVMTIPEGFDKTKASRFQYTHLGDVDQVIATTLPTVPGYSIIASKPIVYGCETLTFDDRGFSGKPTMAQIIAKLTQDAQYQIQSQAIEAECNSVVGVQFSVATSHPSEGVAKVAVTAFGTPCVIVAADGSGLGFAEGKTTDDQTVHSMQSEYPANIAPRSPQRIVSMLGEKSPTDADMDDDSLPPGVDPE